MQRPNRIDQTVMRAMRKSPLLRNQRKHPISSRRLRLPKRACLPELLAKAHRLVSKRWRSMDRQPRVSEDLSFVVEAGALWDDLGQLEDLMECQTEFAGMVVGSAVTGSVTLTAGYVLWALRGGVLVGSVLAQLPAWQFLDPLPILDQSDDSDDEDSDQDGLEDDETLESIIEGAAAQPETPASQVNR